MSAYLVFSTVPNLSSARRISGVILKKRVAACVHLSPSGESHYWWKGKLEKAREVAMTFKTTKKALPSLIRTLKQSHPYETPEIVAVRIQAGHPAYLKWLVKETKFQNS